ncbi:MAG: TadE/TadG family type IV pilus assembly protein [Alphaproteobacteria bacterium]
MTVELALLIPIFVLILLGSVDYGSMIVEKMQLQNAARSGMQYALQSSANIDDTEGIEEVVRLARGDEDEDEELNVSTSVFCECADGSAIVCTATCTGNQPPRRFVDVTVDKNYQMVFSYPGFGNSTTLTGQATVRVR